MNQTYTVFVNENGSDWQGYFGTYTAATSDLAALIDYAAEFRGWKDVSYVPVAWMEGVPHEVLSQEGCRLLRAESIAAGRLIEKVDGKYVARGLDNPAWTQAAEGAAQKYMGIHSPMIATAPEEKLASVKVCEEPKREPLDWNKSTPFDPFKGYEVRSVNEWRTPHTHSHPLQKMAEGKEGFGSAALLKVR